MDNLSIFAERLTDLMTDYGLDSESFANKTGMDASGIRRYLRKEVLPSFKNALKIAEFFGCKLDFLFGLSDECGRFGNKTAAPFSETFRKILQEKGITRYRLCRDTLISDQSADDWFNGKRVPTMENFLKLAEYFDCSLDYLAGRE